MHLIGWSFCRCFLQELATRRQRLIEARRSIASLPCREIFEIAGRPAVAYEVRDYHYPDGRKDARFDLPFLFKAFETGQQPPPRPGTKNAAKPRAATIHEYLDWTVMADEPKNSTDLVRHLPCLAHAAAHALCLADSDHCAHGACRTSADSGWSP